MKRLTLFILLITAPAYAGTTFQDLQSKLTIVPILKGANEDELIYRVKDLKKSAMALRPVEAQAFIIGELISMREAQWKIVNKVFDSRMTALIQEKNPLIAEDLAYSMYISLINEIKGSSPVDISDVSDKLNLIIQKTTANVSFSKEVEELAKMVDIIRRMRELTQKALSKDDLSKMMEAAKQTKYNAVLTIINPAVNELQKGASVHSGSMVVK